MLQPMLGVCSRGRRTPGEHRGGGGAQIGAGHGLPVAGPAVVELAAIREPAIRVEEKEIGRAGRAVRLGHGLCFIDQVGEVVAQLGGFGPHPVGPVLRIRDRIVRVDRDDRESERPVLARKARELTANVLHERAVAADERNEQRLSA